MEAYQIIKAESPDFNPPIQIYILASSRMRKHLESESTQTAEHAGLRTGFRKRPEPGGTL